MSKCLQINNPDFKGCSEEYECYTGQCPIAEDFYSNKTKSCKLLLEGSCKPFNNNVCSNCEEWISPEEETTKNKHL